MPDIIDRLTAQLHPKLVPPRPFKRSTAGEEAAHFLHAGGLPLHLGLVLLVPHLLGLLPGQRFWVQLQRCTSTEQ